MLLSQAQLNAYNDAMNAFQGGAESYFRRLMDAYREERPDAGVAECREFCIVAMEEALGIYAPAAQELAAQMFDYICEAEGIDARAELPAELYDRDMLVEAAHYNAGKLVDGDWGGFVDSESRLANFYVRRSAYEAMRQSCKDGHVRWARVPTGRESCGYCFMLSSRGFDYVSEDTAKAGSHVGCDCIVVPGKQGRTEIEGYHPDELYERWKECQEASGSSDYADVIKEVETRDWDWVWTGKEPPSEHPVDYSANPRETYGRLLKKSYRFNPDDYREENIVDRGNEWRDLFAHDALSENGYDVSTRTSKAIGPDGKVMDGVTTPDISIGKQIWEIKSPQPSSGKVKPGNELNFIGEQMKNARHNFANVYDPIQLAGMGRGAVTPRVVLNLRYREVDVSSERFRKKLLGEMRQYGIEDVIVISKDGSASSYKNSA